uniref:Uncharacterized protein n=1 Tax=Thuretia quercifolia TaxID=189650 RepID=A0A1Z1MKK9_9FLOR|nr:hypothetical protein [Thuretia quercifolia]ARW66419.1 hypothetical protein [Thuretia quercifolia]
MNKIYTFCQVIYIYNMISNILYFSINYKRRYLEQNSYKFTSLTLILK